MSAIEFLAPGLAVLGIIQNPSGAVVPIGEGFAPLLPWRKDAKAEAEETTAANAEPEVGELGLERPFAEADVLLVDRGLGISNDVPRGRARRRGPAGDDGAPRDRRGLGPVRRPARRRRRVVLGRRGCVTGLIGPNGAGKTTLFNVITGLQTPTAGVVLLDGVDVTRAGRTARARLGIARTFQRLEAFGSLTARENVLVALEMRRRWAKDAYDPGKVADELLERVGHRAVADTQVESLPTGSARLVELARALATDPKVLLLDEPSSGLDEQETDALGVLLHELTADGLGVLLVEHDMPLVMEACSYINVLDFGRIIAHGHPPRSRPTLGAARVPRHREDGVMNGQVGTAATTPPVAAGPASSPRCAPATAASTCCTASTSTLAPGEVFALLGPNGAGKSTTLAVASGQITPSSGGLLLCGRDVTGVTARRAGARRRVPDPGRAGHLPEPHRRREPAHGHVHRALLPRRPRPGVRQFPRLRERRKQTAGTMSGGEQQMLSMARALATEPALLLIDELSMGLAPIIVERAVRPRPPDRRPRPVDPHRRAVRPRDPRARRPRRHHAARPPPAHRSARPRSRASSPTRILAPMHTALTQATVR